MGTSWSRDPLGFQQSCNDLFPLIDITQEIHSAILLHPPDTAQMHVKIHEDNVGTLILGQLEPWQMNPRSKHYAVIYHWFWEHLVPTCKIQLVKIATKDQLGDIFTEGLDKATFKNMQKMLVGS
jgi:hypothetical protein